MTITTGTRKRKIEINITKKMIVNSVGLQEGAEFYESYL
jgi:hypothetical protein